VFGDGKVTIRYVGNSREKGEGEELAAVKAVGSEQ
jgi:hypothetical protein